jgi:hypothetical protein
VGHETVRDVEFKPQDFTRRIRIFLAAFIALDNERSADWKGFESVCLGQRNLVPNHQIRFPMSLRVLADYDPAVVRISPWVRRPHIDPEQSEMYSSERQAVNFPASSEVTPVRPTTLHSTIATLEQM